MKNDKRAFFSLILLSVLINAEDIMVNENQRYEPQIIIKSEELKRESNIRVNHSEPQPQPVSPLSTLIQKVKRSEGEDRRVLMNQLKLKLRAMNKIKRHETMKEIKKSFGKGDCQGNHKAQHKQHPNRGEQGYIYGQHNHQNRQLQFRPMHNNRMEQGDYHR